MSRAALPTAAAVPPCEILRGRCRRRTVSALIAASSTSWMRPISPTLRLQPQRSGHELGVRASRVSRARGASYGHPAGGQRRHAEGRALAWEDCLHRRLQGPCHRPSLCTQAQPRRGRARRSCRARWRGARGLRVPVRLLSLLGTRARPRRLRLRTVRRELHGRGTWRRRGLHRRPLPDRRRRLRGHATPCDVLPRRDPDERPAHPRAARVTPASWLLLPCARGGRGAGGGRDRQGRLRPGADDRRRGQCAPLSPRPPAPATASRAADPGPQPRLADVVPGPARWRARRRERRPGRGQPAPGLARVPPTGCHRARAGMRLRHLDPPRGP